MMINLTDDIKRGMLKAINDIGSSFPLDDEEINAIVNDVIDPSVTYIWNPATSSWN